MTFILLVTCRLNLGPQWRENSNDTVWGRWPKVKWQVLLFIKRHEMFDFEMNYDNNW